MALLYNREAVVPAAILELLVAVEFVFKYRFLYPGRAGQLESFVFEEGGRAEGFFGEAACARGACGALFADDGLAERVGEADRGLVVAFVEKEPSDSMDMEVWVLPRENLLQVLLPAGLQTEASSRLVRLEPMVEAGYAFVLERPLELKREVALRKSPARPR